MLRGDSETECLLKELVYDGLDDDDPFFFHAPRRLGDSMLACCFVTACSTGLHRPNALVHSFACMIDPPT
jgi:hypothetical protein